MPFAPLEGASLHYALDGDPSAPVLLLSNSLGATMAMWEPQMAELARHFRVLRHDARGHGQSSVPRGPYALAQLGGDALGLLDFLGIRRAHVCGLSMGGATAMWLAIHHPGRVDRLVLSNTAASFGPAANWDARAAAVSRGGVASIADAGVARWLTPDFAAAHPEHVAQLVAMLAATPAAGYAACCAALRDVDLRADIAGIGAETLVIAGSGDLSTPPAEARFLASRIGDARMLELAAAHLSNQQQPREFSRALIDFLER